MPIGSSTQNMSSDKDEQRFWDVVCGFTGFFPEDEKNQYRSVDKVNNLLYVLIFFSHFFVELCQCGVILVLFLGDSSGERWGLGVLGRGGNILLEEVIAKIALARASNFAGC